MTMTVIPEVLNGGVSKLSGKPSIGTIEASRSTASWTYVIKSRHSKEVESVYWYDQIAIRSRDELCLQVRCKVEGCRVARVILFL